MKTNTNGFLFNALTSDDIENCLALGVSIRQFAIAKIELDRREVL